MGLKDGQGKRHLMWEMVVWGQALSVAWSVSTAHALSQPVGSEGRGGENGKLSQRQTSVN